MSTQLPSLRGLAALAELAKHGRHDPAADALGISRSALSHRISDLEDEVGVTLVGKRGRVSELTEDAWALLAAMGDALEKIEAAVKPLQRRRRQLRLSTVDTFASNWLLPRLRDFQVRHPQIDIAISTTRRLIDFDDDGADCAIRHGNGRWDGLEATLLFRETLAPVAKPGLYAPDHAAWQVIAARSRYHDWTRWWRATARTGPAPTPAVQVETRAQALEACLAGAGVALTDRRYVDAHLAEGRLMLLGPVIELAEGYYFVHRAAGRNMRHIKSMAEWLTMEVAKQRSPMAQATAGRAG